MLVSTFHLVKKGDGTVAGGVRTGDGGGLVGLERVTVGGFGYR